MKYIVALEIAGSQVKGAVGRVNDRASAAIATPEIIAIETAEKVNCVQYGRVQNLIDAAKHTSYVIQKLENNPAVAPGHICCAYVALAGRSLSSVKTAVDLPLPTEMEVTQEIVERLFKEATKTISGDKKVLKVLPRKFMVDNRTVANPVGALGSKLRGEFTVVTCSPMNRRNLELVMDERLHLPVVSYVVTPLAVASMVLGEEEKQLGCCLVDFGAQTTTISIYKDRSLQYLVTLPLGSHNITRDISAGLNLTEERAELAKCAQGSAISEASASANPDAARINCFVQARVGEIVANILAQIGFAGFKPADLSAGFIITGRGAKLKNFCRFLEQQSKMKIRQASVPATVSVMCSGINANDYVPLISIIAGAAADASAPSCVEMPLPQVSEDEFDDEEPEEEYEDNEEESAFDDEDSDIFDEDDEDDDFDLDDDDDDEFWDKDDDEAERLRREKRERISRDRSEQRDRLRRQEEERRRKKHEAQKKEEDRRRREEEKEEKKRREAEEKARKQEQSNETESLLKRIQGYVDRIFSSDPTDDSEDLGE